MTTSNGSTVSSRSRATDSSADTARLPPGPLPTPASPPRRGIDLAALHRLGLDAPVLERALASPPAGAAHARLARVVEVRRDRVLVHDGTSVLAALPWPALRARLQVERDALVVGDWAWIDRGTANAGELPVAADAPCWIVGRVPPVRRLTRRDPAGGQQPLVANIDTALLVMGLDRDFRLARLDRFLVLARQAGTEIAIVLTKADLHESPDEAIARVRAHTGGAWPVVALDARDPGVGEALSAWVRTGRTLALLGSSGAGKSTLARSLAGGPGTGRIGVADASDGDGRGRHTTTARTLHQTANGACVVDTPGLRQLALDVDADGVAEAFDDIAALAPCCRYRDCAHAGEPGCAVAAQVPAERLRSFHKLMREATRDDLGPLDRQRLRARWRRQGQAGRARAAGKRGEG